MAKKKKTKKKSKKNVKKRAKASKSRRPNVPDDPGELVFGDNLLDDLFCAYRKAKADLFFERTQPVSIAFCNYESNLAANLNALAGTLLQGDWCRNPAFIGKTVFVPKSLKKEPIQDSDPAELENQMQLSNPDDEWEALLESEFVYPKVEFRAIAEFTVNMHVVSALWINKVGHKFDACLSDDARGSRVRRVQADDETDEQDRSYHHDVWQTFKPYFGAYKAWRDDGFKAIEDSLDEGKSIVALTLDFAKFYHNIDGKYLTNADFLERSGFNEKHGGLTDAERDFTQQLVTAFQTWARTDRSDPSKQPVGLPVGPTAARIIANTILIEFDQLIREQLSPVYYARYVDDIFLVVEDAGQFDDYEAVIGYLCSRLGSCLKLERDGNLKIEFAYAKDSRLEFQPEKQRFFKLGGQSGRDLLETLRSQINRLSSEWRLLPDLSEFDKSPAARVLSAASDSTEANALRKADGLSIRRLGIALMLRHARSLARDLPPNEWQKERATFLNFAKRHVLTPMRIFDLHLYIPQVLALCVACNDWAFANSMFNQIESVFKKIEEVPRLNDQKLEFHWSGFYDYLRDVLVEAVVTNIRFDRVQVSEVPEIQSLVQKIEGLLVDQPSQTLFTNLLQLNRMLFHRDLAATPYKEKLLGDLGLIAAESTFTGSQNLSSPTESLFGNVSNVLHSQTLSKRGLEIRAFLNAAEEQADDELMPLIFPTRPLGAEEVTICDPDSSIDTGKLIRYVNALRGTWQRDDGNGDAPSDPLIGFGPGGGIGLPGGRPTVVSVKAETRKRKPVIALTSFQTDDASWCQAAAGQEDLSRERYTRLERLCRNIIRESYNHKIDYVIFPELSIPRSWLLTVARMFTWAGISFIAGVEYGHRNRIVNAAGQSYNTVPFVTNEAFMFLTDDRLGYPSWVVFRQQKSVPAIHEGEELRQKFGLSLFAESPMLSDKRIYRHAGFEFGLLICSELTNIQFRQKFRGNVDSLLVLSWNRDLESFASLVESAALDVHCFTVLVNNRKYGDSRVRAPFKESYLRDMVRVKGGLADYFVLAEIDYEPLRDFQSYAHSKTTPFKPFPEGFAISNSRRVVPGGKNQNG